MGYSLYAGQKEDQRQLLLIEATRISATKPYWKITPQELGQKDNLSVDLVTTIFDNDFENYFVRDAIENENYKVIVEAIVNQHPEAVNLPKFKKELAFILYSK